MKGQYYIFSKKLNFFFLDKKSYEKSIFDERTEKIKNIKNCEG